MQRRAGLTAAGRGLARIAAPVQRSPSTDFKTVSRLSRRNLGVTNRIWALIAAVLCILLLTHLAFPASLVLPQDRTRSLEPKIYLSPMVNATGPNPFPWCPAHGPQDTLKAKYGVQTLLKTRLHAGNSERVQRVLVKAMAGEPVTISVLGGSVSACHGAGDDPVSPQCYPSIFFDWWTSVFPHPATELTNGAMRRTGSDYFGFCSAHHLPDTTDLIIIEVDSEDRPGEANLAHFELLVRSLLLRPSAPAVLLLSHFSPQSYQSYHPAGPDHWHVLVAQHYDVPYISLRPFLLSAYINDRKSINKYYADAVLSNPAGHELMRDVLLEYFQEQICTKWSAVLKQVEAGSVPGGTQTSTHGAETSQDGGGGAGWLFGGAGPRPGAGAPEEDHNKHPGAAVAAGVAHPHAAADKNIKRAPSVGVPPNLLTSKPNPNPNAKFEEIAPFCASANDLVNPLPSSLFYGTGWHVFHEREAEEGKRGGGDGKTHPTAHYWYSVAPGSRIRVPIVVGAGDVGVYYIREPAGSGDGSWVECYVDDNVGGKRRIRNKGQGTEEEAVMEMIDRYVTRGSHFVECVLGGDVVVGGGTEVQKFRLLSVVAT